MKKRALCFLTGLFAVLIFSGCNSVLPTQDEVPEKGKLKVGLYVDRGSSGGGLMHWAAIAEFSPQAELVTLTGEDVRNGKLKDVNVVIMPGGYPSRQLQTLKPEGIEIFRKWIQDGGCYVGSCAGLATALSHKSRLRLLPFYRRANSGGTPAMVKIMVNERGAELMGVKPGLRKVKYACGSIPTPAKVADKTRTGEVLAIYKCSIGSSGKEQRGFYDLPSLVYGTLGKGKAIASSYHPEYLESSLDLAVGMIYAVTGVKLTPQFPVKDRRPIRLGFCTSAVKGHYPVRECMKLEHQKHIDVRYFMLPDIDDGELNHIDVLILPDGIAESNRSFFRRSSRWAMLKKFMDRGGIILASGNAAKPLPEHKNLKKFPAGADFSKYLADK